MHANTHIKAKNTYKVQIQKVQSTHTKGQSAFTKVQLTHVKATLHTDPKVQTTKYTHNFKKVHKT